MTSTQNLPTKVKLLHSKTEIYFPFNKSLPADSNNLNPAKNGIKPLKCPS
jgi:hypothetical protein